MDVDVERRSCHGEWGCSSTAFMGWRLGSTLLVLSLVLSCTGCDEGFIRITSGNDDDITNPIGDDDPDDHGALQGIQVATDTVNVATNQLISFLALGSYEDGTVNPLTSGVTWISSNEGVGVFVAPGVLQTQSNGVTVISAAFQGLASNSVILHVQSILVESVSIEAERAAMTIGESFPLRAFADYQNGTRVDVTTEVIWLNSAPGLLAIQTGNPATAIAIGSGDVSLAASFQGMTSAAAEISLLPTVESLLLRSAGTLVAVGSSVELDALGISMGDATVMSDIVSWQVSAVDGAEVQELVQLHPGLPALLEMLSPGVVDVSASYGDVVSDTRRFVIVPREFQQVAFNVAGSVLEVDGILFGDDVTPSSLFHSEAESQHSVWIEGAVDPRLYQSSRTGEIEFALPLPPGRYRVETHYAEPQLTAVSGDHVFDLWADGERVETQLDIADAVGTRHAWVREFDLNVTDGILDLEWRRVSGDPRVCGLRVTAIATEGTWITGSGTSRGKIAEVRADADELLEWQLFGAGDALGLDLTEVSQWRVRNSSVAEFSAPGVLRLLRSGVTRVDVRHGTSTHSFRVRVVGSADSEQ